jgi:hypothetical protein
MASHYFGTPSFFLFFVSLLLSKSSTNNIMSSTQLHNPLAVWFLGAPISKAIAISTAIMYVMAEMNKWHDALILGEWQFCKK